MNERPKETVVIAVAVTVLVVFYFFYSFLGFKDPTNFKNSLSFGAQNPNGEKKTNNSASNTDAELSSSGEGVYYLYLNKLAPDNSCSVSVPVLREGDIDGRGREAAAVFQLMKKPTEAEANNGFRSFLAEDTMSAIESVSVRGDAAYVNLVNISTKVPATKYNCVRRSIQSSIEKTLKQFGTVSSVNFSMNGSEELFTQWIAR